MQESPQYEIYISLDMNISRISVQEDQHGMKAKVSGFVFSSPNRRTAVTDEAGDILGLKGCRK